MKLFSKSHILPWLSLGAGLLGVCLRLWLYAGGSDEKGLLVTGHPANILLFALTAAVMAVLFLRVRALGHAPGYSHLFPRSVPAAIGNGVAAVAMLLSLPLSLSATTVLGLLAAVSFAYLAFCALRHLRPAFWLHGIITVYFMVYAVGQYRVFSTEPQISVYFFELLAAVFLMLTFYYRSVLDVEEKGRSAYVFCNQAALFFCCVSLVGGTRLFYLAMVVWTATNLCSLKSVTRHPRSKTGKQMHLPESALFCIRTLENAGHRAYAVGGCVRDDLLGLTPQDYDLCTSATPNQIAEIFSAYPLVRSGEKHGTIGVILAGGVYEITTFRAEGGYTDSRHPDWVEFVSTVEEDLSRRDFTVNAMAYAPEKGFVDPWGGKKDLRDHILRTVGDPTERFTEDPLRILRGIRFAVRYQLTPEPETEKAMVQLAYLMDNLARERVFDELCKLLPLVTAEDLTRFAPILVYAIPELQPTVGFDQHNRHHEYDVFTHTAHVVEAVPPVLPLRWAALLHDVGKVQTFTIDEDGQGHFKGHAKVSAEIADQVLLRLRASNELRQQVVLLIEQHMTPLTVDKKILRRRLGQYGVENVRNLLALQQADFGSKKLSAEDDPFAQVEAVLEEILAEAPCLTSKDLAINGRDILALGIPAGPAIGECMTHLLRQVQDEVLPNTKEALTQAATEYFQL